MAKPSIALLLGGKGKEDEEEDPAETDDEDHRASAAEELIAAVKEGDAAKVLKAFDAIQGLGSAEEEDTDEEE